MLRRVRLFIQVEAMAGLLLFVGAVLALLVSNTELKDQYLEFVHLPIHLTVGELSIDTFLIESVNDGLMALFFLMLTLEAKFHFLTGDRGRQSSLPLASCAALGGVVIPALMYVGVAGFDAAARAGWAIPIATDTAFVLGILSLLSRRVPTSARVFVLHLSIIDDVLAVLCLAIFYTPGVHLVPLACAAFLCCVLAALNVFNVHRLSAYVLAGLGLWIALLESGVHGTLAGVVLGLFVPLHVETPDKTFAPSKRLEALLHPFVAFLVLPLFSFLNSGFSFSELNVSDLQAPVTAGIIAGLVVGKQLGIVLSAAAYLYLKKSALPHGLCWRQFYGISVLCGIGFTFSLFISLLSFDDPTLLTQAKLGVTLGSALAAALGIGVLLRAGRSRPPLSA